MTINITKTNAYLVTFPKVEKVFKANAYLAVTTDPIPPVETDEKIYKGLAYLVMDIVTPPPPVVTDTVISGKFSAAFKCSDPVL
jgi:hypothetical protein